MSKDADFQNRMQAVSDQVHKVLKQENDPQKNDPIVIPVVVHIVWFDEANNITAQRIHDQIRVLNEVFTNTHKGLNDVPDNFKSMIGNPQLNFCLAAEDPFGDPADGILRTRTNDPNIGRSDNLFFTEFGGSTAWDTERYLNIWITENVGATGYAFFPNTGDTNRDGVVLDTKVVNVGGQGAWNNGRVAVHEIGHYLGLKHLWGDDISLREDPACDNDDGFSDTPPQLFSTYACPENSEDIPTSCGTPDMYVNYMDYTEDACLNMFTAEQTAFMRTVLGEFRPGLIKGGIKCHPVSPQRGFTPFFVYPNPTTDRFFVDFDAYGEERSHITIELYNINGGLLLRQKAKREARVEVFVGNLPKGIYLVKVGDAVKKLFKG